MEIDNGCTAIEISAGQGASCFVTNTVFIEGIPATGRYGQLLLILLLGAAAFAFYRRVS